MIKSFKPIILGLLLALGLILIPSSIYANNNVNTNNNRVNNNVKKVNFGICNARRHNAINIARFYTKQTDRMIANYQRRVAMYETLSQNFSKAGKNTDELDNDINTLKTKINELESDINILVSKATNFQTVDCESGEWQQMKDELFAAQKKINQDKIGIEMFIRTEINPDIAALRKVVVTPTPTLTPTPTP